MTDLEADSAALRMQSASLPLDVLADELGAAAGRIERELRLQDEARAARFEARLAAIELAAFRAEEDRERRFQARLAELKDGKDGEPGRDGKDADVAHLEEQVSQRLASLTMDFSDWAETINGRVETKLAEVKDGKDGEPGKDGETPDLEQIKQELFKKVKEKVNDAFEAFQKNIEMKVAQVDKRLSEVKDGKDGEPGQPGKDGQDGKLPIAREWTNRVHYEGDVVRHNGSTYQALADTGQQPPHSDWGELASRGADGIGFVLRGTYDAAAYYKQHDIVMINRNSFAAKCDSPGECPGDGWQLFGPSGQRGKEGPPGPRGLPGTDGRSVSITKWEADPDSMALRITDSSGNSYAVDLQPIAERIVEAAR